MERVDGNVIYLKDGTIYGAIYSNGEISQYPDINGEKIVSKGAFNYSSVTVTKSGKVYIVSGYDGDMNTYVYTLDENEKVLINRDGNIYTKAAPDILSRRIAFVIRSCGREITSDARGDFAADQAAGGRLRNAAF